MWNYEPLLPPRTATSLKPIQLYKSSHRNNWYAGRTVETVGKQKPSSLSQNKPERRRGIGCTGWVTVDRVRPTDEWVQEAVMSDIFSSDKVSQTKNKKIQTRRQKDTGSLLAKNSLVQRKSQWVFLFIIYWKDRLKFWGKDKEVKLFQLFLFLFQMFSHFEVLLVSE